MPTNLWDDIYSGDDPSNPYRFAAQAPPPVSTPSQQQIQQQRFADANAAQAKKLTDWVAGQQRYAAANDAQAQKLTDWIAGQKRYNEANEAQAQKFRDMLAAGNVPGTGTQQTPQQNFAAANAAQGQKLTDWVAGQRRYDEANAAQQQKLTDWIESQKARDRFSGRAPAAANAPGTYGNNLGTQTHVQQMPQSQRAAKPMSPLFAGPQSQPGMFGGPGQPKQRGDFLPAFGQALPTQQRTITQTDPGAGYASSPSNPNWQPRTAKPSLENLYGNY